MTLQWRADAHTYYDTAKGRLLTKQELTALRNVYAAAAQADLEDGADDYAQGRTGHGAWRAAFAAGVGAAIIGGYVLGAGGADRLGDPDYEALARILDGQQPYMDGFADDAATLGDDGGMSADELIARAGMYAGNAAHAFNVGNGATYDGLDLPYYPADGGTACLSNCRCSWSIEEDDEGWTATWVLESESGACEGCLARADEYGPDSPFIQDKDASEEQ